MTLTDITNEVLEVGTGSKTNFDFDFKIQNTSDIEVYKMVTTTKVATLQTITTNYTVAINATSDGGTVSYVVNPLATETSIIRRVPAYTQATDIPVAGSVSETQLEGEFDKRAMVALHNKFLVDRAALYQTSSIITVGAGSPDTVDTDLSLGSVFDFAPTDAFIINNPTNPPTGFGLSMQIVWRITHGASASKTMTFGTKFRVATSVAADLATLGASLSTASGTVDYLTAVYNLVDDKYDIIAFASGLV